MNREIKFRQYLWDNDTKKIGSGRMMNWNEILDESEESLSSTFTQEFSNTSPLMQFIGIKDKNEQDIYEGDIVEAYQKLWQIPQPLICQIDYNTDKARFEPVQFWKDRNEWLCLSDEFGRNYDYEIIGNIYENPELLKKE